MATGDGKYVGRFPHNPLRMVGWYSDFVVETAGMTGKLNSRTKLGCSVHW